MRGATCHLVQTDLNKAYPFHYKDTHFPPQVSYLLLSRRQNSQITLNYPFAMFPIKPYNSPILSKYAPFSRWRTAAHSPVLHICYCQHLFRLS
uniref:Uncharacterized protein n=1 Tax=Arundo donax TaxID=35708 RepID=A0A0A9E4L6_ARUDO